MPEKKTIERAKRDKREPGQGIAQALARDHECAQA
jgi:hypothetical protein